jgi:hypothetical protein
VPDTASRSGLFYQKTSAGYRGRSGLGEEIGQRGPGPLRIILHRDVAGAGHRDEVRIGHLLFEAARSHGLELVFLPPQEQRRQAISLSGPPNSWVYRASAAWAIAVQEWAPSSVRQGER